MSEGADWRRLVNLRRATGADATAVADLWSASRRASVPANPPAVHDDADVRRYFRDEVLPNAEVWLLEQNDDPLAFLALRGHSVEHLHVAPGYTGSGLGTRLLDHAKSRSEGHLELWSFQSTPVHVASTSDTGSLRSR